MEDSEQPARSSISVREILDDTRLGIGLSVAAGQAGLHRRITHTRIQKSGLALVGHRHGVVPTRIQILGETEISYLEKLDQDAQDRAASGYLELGLSCVVVTRGVWPTTALV